MSEGRRMQWASKFCTRLIRVQPKLEVSINRDNKQQFRTCVSPSKTGISLPVQSSANGKITNTGDFQATSSVMSLLRRRALGGRVECNIIAEDLIALTQHTISPDISDDNDSNVSIWYCAPIPALVVKTSGGDHRRIGKLLDQIRVAGP